MLNYKIRLLEIIAGTIVFVLLNGIVAEAGGNSPLALQENANGKPIIQGPLKVHPTNPRYFTDGTKTPEGSLKAVYLTGSHTWNSLQDLGKGDPPPAFDFNGYMDFLGKNHHNFIRLWRWELFKWRQARSQEADYCIPQPWARTGTEMALDGKPKYNLEQFDDAFFQRLRERVIAARDRGIYVSVMLFEGWGLRFESTGWQGHPFNKDNNMNGIDGDKNRDRRGVEIFTMVNPAVTAAQEAYVRHVIDTVNDLDNVLYEISNENDTTTTEWQYHLIRFIKDYESTKPYRHPVGMTPDGYGGDDDTDRIFNSPADWVSPTPDRFDYKTDPPAATGEKVVISDTDHLWGLGGDVPWVWKSFLRGLNPILMDSYDGSVLGPPFDPQLESPRRALGHTLALADRIDLAAMTPQSDLSSSKYCLANLGKEYVVYLPEGGEVTVDLSAASGELAVEWIHPTEGDIEQADTISGGGKKILQSPFPGDAVLYLKAKSLSEVGGVERDL